MFSKLALIVTSACTLAAVAAPTSTGGYTCTASGETVECCDRMEKASDMSDTTRVLMGGLGVNPATLTGLIGLDCSLPLGENPCTQQTVCCNDNNFKGLVVLGCSPVNVVP